MGFTAPKADIENTGGFSAPSSDVLLGNGTQATAGDFSNNPNKPDINQFLPDVGKFAAGTVAGIGTELIDQAGNAGNFVGLDNNLSQTAADIKQQGIDLGLLESSFNTGSGIVQGGELAAGFATGVTGLALAEKAASKAIPFIKLSKIGAKSVLPIKVAAAPVRLLGRALEDSLVNPAKQIAAQTGAFSAASGATENIDNEGLKVVAEMALGMSALGIANGLRLSLLEEGAGAQQIGRVIAKQPNSQDLPVIDSVDLTLANETLNPTVKATENVLRAKDQVFDQEMRNIEDANFKAAGDYAETLANKGSINDAELESVRAAQVQSVQSQIDMAVTKDSLEQTGASSFSAGKDAEIMISKIADEANAAASQMYDKVGDSVISAKDMLKPISEALNIADLKISASAIYPKIETLLKGMRSTVLNKPDESLIAKRKDILSAMKQARKDGDFTKATELKSNLAIITRRINSGAADKTPVGTLTIGQIQGARSLLLSGIREAKASGMPDLARRYSKVLDGIEASLTKAESKGNIDVKLLRDANTQWREVKKITNIGEFGNALKTTKGGDSAISEELLGKRLIKLNTQDGIKTANQLLNAKNRYGVNDDEFKATMRSQFAAMIADKAASTSTGRLSATQMSQFVNSHSQALKAYGIADDFAGAVNAAKATDIELSKLGAEMNHVMNRSATARLLNTDNPSQVIRSYIRSGKASDLVNAIEGKANKDAIRGMIIREHIGDVNSAFSGNKMQEALGNKDILNALGDNADGFVRLANTITKLNVKSNGATPIREARLPLPETRKKIERLGRRMFATIRTPQNKILLTFLEGRLESANLASHEILTMALKNGKSATMLADFGLKNPEEFRFILSEQAALSQISNTNQQENNNANIQR